MPIHEGFLRKHFVISLMEVSGSFLVVILSLLCSRKPGTFPTEEFFVHGGKH